jgi:hypothetical protein
MRRRRNLKSREEGRWMAVLKAPPKQPKTTVVQLRLCDQARIRLTKYAECLECSPSYVVSEVLKLLYRKDKQFRTWLSNKGEAISKGDSLQLEFK